MPLSALSPHGPVSLVGMDVQTLENLRERNRREKLFSAKCCGAPVQIRTAEGRIAHFFHLSKPTSCEGERKETPEHLRLKHEVAFAIINTGWDHQPEAQEHDEYGKVLWRADVLASKWNRKRRVAFEIQLSNADWNEMLARQSRYLESGVRGLWFVRTRKGFPARKELPVFVVDSGDDGDWVQLSRRFDTEDVWEHTHGADQVSLRDFVYSALTGELKWAPFVGKPETPVDVWVGYAKQGTCKGCGRTLGRQHSVTVRLAGSNADQYPQYKWHWRMSPTARTKWSGPLVNQVWEDAKRSVDVALLGKGTACCWCGLKADGNPHMESGYGSLASSATLGDLPKPAFGTIEWDWLNRWVVLS